MSCGTNIQKNDIGTALLVTIKDEGVVLDISSATTKNFIIEKPDGSVVTKSASFYTDGTDGKLLYVTVDGDLDISGLYQLQAYLVFSAGSFYSTISSFKVKDNLE